MQTQVFSVKTALIPRAEYWKLGIPSQSLLSLSWSYFTIFELHFPPNVGSAYIIFQVVEYSEFRFLVKMKVFTSVYSSDKHMLDFTVSVLCHEVIFTLILRVPRNRLQPNNLKVRVPRNRLQPYNLKKMQSLDFLKFFLKMCFTLSYVSVCQSLYLLIISLERPFHLMIQNYLRDIVMYLWCVYNFTLVKIFESERPVFKALLSCLTWLCRKQFSCQVPLLTHKDDKIDLTDCFKDSHCSFLAYFCLT